MQLLLNFLDFFEYIFWFVVVFTVIVFIHEFGHYYIARLNKVAVEKFSIGFGPVLFSFKDKNNTKWQVCLIPLGGYVKFLGEMYSNKKINITQNNKNFFMNKKPLQKASIVFAGPAANFILSFVLFAFIFCFYGHNKSSNYIGLYN